MRRIKKNLWLLSFVFDNKKFSDNGQTENRDNFFFFKEIKGSHVINTSRGQLIVWSRAGSGSEAEEWKKLVFLQICQVKRKTET